MDVVLCDMDAFFASIEQRDKPAWRGKPVIVGGLPDQRGVVATCSYEARRFGVRSAMPLRTAGRLCPQGIFVPPRMSVYRAVSAEVRRILGDFSPTLEAVSIDEAFLAVAPNRGSEVARAAQARILSELHLPSSFGVGPNRLLAKLAVEMAKPAGVREIRAQEAKAVLAPLPVRKLPGVGPQTERTLAELGIRTVGQLAARSPAWLRQHFGKRGEWLQRAARGEDDTPVGLPSVTKSMGEETTFPVDLPPEADLRPILAQLCEAVGMRLRKHGFAARTVTLKLRYHDFTTVTRAHTAPEALVNDADLLAQARRLLERHREPRPVRLLGIYVSGFEPLGETQSSLWDDASGSKRERLAQAVDRLRSRYGATAVRLARGLAGEEQNRQTGQLEGGRQVGTHRRPGLE